MTIISDNSRKNPVDPLKKASPEENDLEDVIVLDQLIEEKKDPAGGGDSRSLPDAQEEEIIDLISVEENADNELAQLSGDTKPKQGLPIIELTDDVPLAEDEDISDLDLIIEKEEAAPLSGGVATDGLSAKNANRYTNKNNMNRFGKTLDPDSREESAVVDLSSQNNKGGSSETAKAASSMSKKEASPLDSLSEKQIEKALEEVIHKKFSEKIDKILSKVIEKTITKDIERLKEKLKGEL